MMRTAREFYDAVVDCEGDIQGTVLIAARDREVAADTLRWAASVAVYPRCAEELRELADRAERGE